MWTLERAVNISRYKLSCVQRKIPGLTEVLGAQPRIAPTPATRLIEVGRGITMRCEGSDDYGNSSPVNRQMSLSATC